MSEYIGITVYRQKKGKYRNIGNLFLHELLRSHIDILYGKQILQINKALFSCRGDIQFDHMPEYQSNLRRLTKTIPNKSIMYSRNNYLKTNKKGFGKLPGLKRKIFLLVPKNYLNKITNYESLTLICEIWQVLTFSQVMGCIIKRLIGLIQNDVLCIPEPKIVSDLAGSLCCNSQPIKMSNLL